MLATVIQTTLLPVFFCEDIRVKKFFVASFHTSMHSQMFYKIDVPEISSRFIGKNPVPDSLYSSKDVFQIIF